MSTIIVLLSISLISAYPGQVKLNTPDGSLNLILKDDAQNLVEQGQLSSYLHRLRNKALELRAIHSRPLFP